MKKMGTTPLAWAAAVCALLWAGCGRQEPALAEPQTPEEMYARVRELLQPNAQHEASDFAQAMEWLRRAAEAGHRQAQTDLGGIYLEGGKGDVQADGKQAYDWFARAAAQGSREALYYMGLILHAGKDVPQDKPQALQLWRRAAEAGVAEAQLALGLELAQAAGTVPEGVAWLTRAVQAEAAKTAAQAARALGFIYAKGRPGVPQDLPEAARWYKLAADGGDAAAQLVYALMLLEGKPVAKNEAQGVRYLRLAAGQDYPAAMQMLAQLLRAAKNETEAAAWEQRLESLRQKAEAEAAH